MSVYEQIADWVEDIQQDSGMTNVTADFGKGLAGQMDQLMGPQKEEREAIAAQSVVQVMACIEAAMMINRDGDPLEQASDEDIN